MNDVLKPIFDRRSIRAYEDQPVPERTVRDLLEAAMAAPSAVAKDPWDFITITDSEMLKKVAEGLPNGKMLGEAPLGIMVCGSLERAHDNELSYMLQDCSAAIENILLAASMLGLGACWLGVHPREDRVNHIRSLLDVPEQVTPLAAITVGRPAETKEPRTRYDAGKVHAEGW